MSIKFVQIIFVGSSRTLRTFCKQQLTRFQQYSQTSLDWPSIKIFQINLYHQKKKKKNKIKKKKKKKINK